MTVTLDGNRTVGTMLFGDTNPSNNWILNAGSPSNSVLTLAVSSGSPLIDVANTTQDPIPSSNSINFFPSVTQSATFNVVIAGTSGLTKTGDGTLIFTRANTYTGTTSVKDGALTLDFSASGAPTSNILANTSSLSLGGGLTSATGGALSIVGASGSTISQTVAATTFDFGGNSISVTQNGATSVSLALGTVSRTNHGSLNLTLPTSGSITATNASIANTNGIIGAWATIGTGSTASWAANNGSGTIIAYSAFTDVTGSPTISNGATTNVRWKNSTGDAATGSVTTDINTLLFTDTTDRTLSIASGRTLRLGAKGGIFKSDATASGTLTIGDSGSVLTAGGAANTAGELVLKANGLTPDVEGMKIFSSITDNGSGVVTLVSAGNAAIRLEATNTYSGGTYIDSGRVRVQAAGGFGTGDVYVAEGAQAYIGAGTQNNNFFLAGKGFYEGGNASGGFFTGGALRLAGNTAEVAGTITLLEDSLISSRGAAGAGAIISGKITGNFNLDFNETATTNGILILSNSANDWGGDTTIKTGVLRIGGSGNVLPDGAGKGNVIIHGDTINSTFPSVLDLNGKSETINGLSSTGDTTQIFIENDTTSSTGTLTVGGNDQTSSFAGVIRNNNGTGGTMAIVKTGTGTLILSGTNTYTGSTTVSGGILQGTTTSLQGNITDNANVTFDQSTSGTYSSILSGTGSVTKSSNGSVTFSAANTYSGSTTISAVARILGNANAAQNSTVTVNVNSGLQFATGITSYNIGGLAGTGNFQLLNAGAASVALSSGSNGASTIYSGVLSSTGSLTKNGSGALTLSGANTYSGGTTLSAGTLSLNNATAIGTGGFTIASSTTIDNTSGGAITLSNNNTQTWNGSFTFTGSNAAESWHGCSQFGR